MVSRIPASAGMTSIIGKFRMLIVDDQEILGPLGNFVEKARRQITGSFVDKAAKYLEKNRLQREIKKLRSQSRGQTKKRKRACAFDGVIRFMPLAFGYNFAFVASAILLKASKS